jgi:hypothetical protein
MKTTIRKVLAAMLVIALAFAFAACTSGGNDTPSGGNGNGGTETADSYAFKWNGKAIRPGDVGTDMKALAGEWKSCFESPSCAFEGIDKTYTFAGFVIDTTPSEDGKDDIIKAIRLTDDSVTTAENVYVGMTAEAIKNVYGESAGVSDACLRFVKGGVEIQFIIQDNKAISIEYIPAE